MFKVMKTSDQLFNNTELPSHIPISALNEDWAQKIHSQSLSRLNERGGLTSGEIVVNVERRPFDDLFGGKITEDYAIEFVRNIAPNPYNNSGE